MKAVIRSSSTAKLLLCGLLFGSASPATSFGSENSRFRLIGTAIFQGDASALIEVSSTSEQRFVEVNDIVDGFTIKDIAIDKIVLEKEGKSFQIASGAQPPVMPVTTLEGQPVVKQAPTASPKLTSSAAKATRKTSSSSGVVFSSPLAGRLVSGFGQRKDPWGGGTKTHNGVDIAAPQGTRIRAAADGKVKEAGYKGLLGRYVILEHDDNLETVYGHMYRHAVKAGQEVSRGDVIGYEGSTGRSTGPHLHFEIHKNGVQIDPSRYLPHLKK